MTEDMANPNLKPQTEMLFLLGSIDAKVGGLQSEVSNVKSTLDREITSIKAEVSGVKVELGSLRSDVDVLESKQKPAAPWWSVAAGLAAVTTLILFIAQYFGAASA